MDNRPSALTLAIVGCVLVFVGGIGLWATQAEGELAARFVTALASLITGVPIIVGLLVLSAWGVACVPTLVRAWDWWEARKSSKNVTKSVTNETETKTRQTARNSEAWRTYWLGMFEYARDEGGITFNKTMRYFGTKRASALATWKAAIKPFIRAYMIDPIVERETTGFCDGFTLDGVIALLKSGQNIDPLYIPPFSPPAPFESLPDDQREPEKPGGNQREQAYSPDTADTVYAKDV